MRLLPRCLLAAIGGCQPSEVPKGVPDSDTFLDTSACSDSWRRLGTARVGQQQVRPFSCSAVERFRVALREFEWSGSWGGGGAGGGALCQESRSDDDPRHTGIHSYWRCLPASRNRCDHEHTF